MFLKEKRLLITVFRNHGYKNREFKFDTPNIKNHVQPKPKKTPKGKKKGEKAPTTSTNKVQKLVERLLKYPPKIKPLATDVLFNLFILCF